MCHLQPLLHLPLRYLLYVSDVSRPHFLCGTVFKAVKGAVWDKDTHNLKDPSLYHYVILSDNVLVTFVVENSTVLLAKELGKHVFHIVTGKLNFAAMKIWFLVNPPARSTI